MAGALSYFIGTEYLILAEQDGEILVFPPGNENGIIFQEYGLGIANQPAIPPFTNVTNVGWFNSTSYDFEYRTEGKNCETAVGLGRICFGYNLRMGETEMVTNCVDKTFTFVEGESDLDQLNTVFTSHHSSSSNFESPPSIVYCQEPSVGNPDVPRLTNNVTTCVV
jgi:hypothetical protein